MAESSAPAGEGVLYEMRIAECGNLKKCILQNFTCGTFCKLHLRFFSTFRRIQIKSNNQLQIVLQCIAPSKTIATAVNSLFVTHRKQQKS